jgi:cytochrome c biogenesis protein CcdA
MIVALLAYLGGVLTILSPCILPVLPFVFARTAQPFARSTLPLLIGMALTFALISTLAAVGGAWAVHFNTYGRVIALIVLAVSAFALLSPHFAEWITRPFVSLGARMTERPAGSSGGVATSLLLGVATGFLWAPCAGPVLGLILTGAALRGPSAGTTVLLLAYALGAATSLAVAAFASTRVIAALKRSLGAGQWLRRGLGVAVLAAVVAVLFGWDTGVLTRLSVGSTQSYEQSLIARFAPRLGAPATNSPAPAESGSMIVTSTSSEPVKTEGQLPSLAGAVAWLNSPPLTPQALRG